MYVCLRCCIVIHEHYLYTYILQTPNAAFYHGNATYAYSSSYSGGVMGVSCMYSVLWKDAYCIYVCTYCIYVCTLVVHASSE